jgi:uncharacterized membrane protein YkoI
MTLKTRTPLGTLLLASGITAASIQVGLAGGTGTGKETAEAEALMKSRITLVQAVQVAETKAGGRASSADFISQEGTSAPFYQVEILTADGSRQNFAIEASTGEVVELANAKRDSGDNGAESSGENGRN